MIGTGTVVGEMQEDFITQLLRLINSGRGDEATEKILEIDRLQDQLDTLERLSIDLGDIRSELQFELALLLPFYRARAIDLALDLDRALARARALDLSRALARAIDFALTLILALDRDPDRARVHDRARALALDLDRNLDLDRALDRDRALARARALARDFERAPDLDLLQILVQSIIFLLSIYYIPQNVQESINSAYQQIAANVYEESLYQQAENPSPLIDVIVDVIHELFGDDIRYITLEGIDHITPDILAYDIAPYLQALGKIQRIYCELNGKPFAEPRIIQIHNELPKVEIIGIADIFRAINDIFSWRKRGQEANLRDLQIKKQQLQTELLEAKIKAQIQQITIEKNRQLDTQEKALRIAILQEEYQQKQIETRQKQAELDQTDLEKMRVYYALAEELLPRLAPDGISLEQKIEYLPKLAHYIKMMEESPLTMRIGYHDVPRPPTLPEEK